MASTSQSETTPRQGQSLYNANIACVIDIFTTAELPKDKKEEEEFSRKTQIMTLMMTDIDHVSDFSWHIFSLIDMSAAC